MGLAHAHGGQGGGAPRAVFVTLQDITARKQAREDIAYLAAHDSLTGLFNRLVFHSELAEAIVLYQADEIVATLFLDLDDFKVINDTLGHPTGDAILVEMAKRLRTTVAKGDIVARLGGNEFAVLHRAAANEARSAPSPCASTTASRRSTRPMAVR